MVDPIVVALAGVVSTLAGILYRALIHRAERAERNEDYWRDKALTYLGSTDLALDEAEKRERR